MTLSLRFNMKKCNIFLYLSYFLLFVRESKGQVGFCRQDKPGLRFCTDNWWTNLTDVNIDTSRVPRFQETVCECTIFPYVRGAIFTFLYYDRVVPRNMVLKLNDVLLLSIANMHVWKTDRAKLSLLTTKNYTTEGTCLVISTDDNIRFNISCSDDLTIIMSTNLVTDIPTSVKQGGMISETPEESTTTETQGLSETEHISVAEITVIVVPTVIGVLLVLAATVTLVYIKRRRLTTETKLREHDHQQQLSELGTEQGQGNQSNTSNKDRGHEIPVNAYERLNMYVNSSLAGERYQQLDVDKSEEYQKMPNVKRNAGNQDRCFTKQINLQEPDHERTQSKAESLKGQGRGQENAVNGGKRDLEISSNAYERLNLYVNDNLAGEMYEQLAADQTRDYRQKYMPCNEDKPDHKTNANEITPAIYTNTLLQNNE